MFSLLDKHIKNGSLNHAYIVVGDPTEVSKKIDSLIRDNLDQSNPDIFLNVYDDFYIENSHDFIRSQSRKVFGEDSKGRFFVLGINNITREAQNSLLKIVEEPPVGSHTFIVVSNLNKLLPTLCSRCVVLNSGGRVGSVIDVKNFIKSSIPQRLKMLESFLIHPETDEEKTKRKKTIEIFLNDLEKEICKSEDHKKNGDQILLSRRYLNMTAPSYRMILENLALYI